MAGWIVGCWLQITGCVHTSLTAKQAMPGSPRSALQHAFNLHTHHRTREQRVAGSNLTIREKGKMCRDFFEILHLDA